MRLFTIIFFLFIFKSLLIAQCTILQNQYNTGGIGNGFGWYIGQSFVACESGTLDFVQVSTVEGSKKLKKSSPKDFFAAPVSGQLRLSGTFGELRPDHFHSGIDIKGGLGVPIYAAGDGEVYCIKINPGGYGSVMYIWHPN